MIKSSWIFILTVLLCHSVSPAQEADISLPTEGSPFPRLGTNGYLKMDLQIGLSLDVPLTSSGYDTIDGSLTHGLGDLDLGGDVGFEVEVTPKNSPWSFVYRISSPSEEQHTEGYFFYGGSHNDYHKEIELDTQTVGLRYTIDAGDLPLFLVGKPVPTYLYVGGGIALFDLDYEYTKETWTSSYSFFESNWHKERTHHETLAKESADTTGQYLEAGFYQMITDHTHLGFGYRYITADPIEFQGNFYSVDEQSVFFRIGFFF